MTPRSSIVFFFIFFFFQSEAQYSTHSLINVAFRAVLSPAICNEWCIALYVPRCTLPYFFFFRIYATFYEFLHILRKSILKRFETIFAESWQLSHSKLYTEVNQSFDLHILRFCSFNTLPQ